MHPWHDITVDENQGAERIPVVIEVPRGSKNKYELDKVTGMLRLDRVLYSAVHYPADYGFVPGTLCDDGDALDALMLCQEPVTPLTIVASWIWPLRAREMDSAPCASLRPGFDPWTFPASHSAR